MADTRRSLSALQAIFADNTSGDVSPQDGRDELISSHPEKTCQTAAEASAPSSGQLSGDLFLPSDGFWLKRWSGSAWAPWGPLFPLTDPALQTFAWVNQGGASVVTTQGGVHLSCASNVSAQSWRVRKKAAPATPYTITAAFVLNHNPWTTGTQGYAGLVFRESSSGKLQSFHVVPINQAGSLSLVESYKWTNETTFSASYGGGNSGPARAPLVWIRIADDGTSRKCSISADGQNWIEVHSVGRTDFLTADEVGFAVNPFSLSLGMTLLSWKEG